MSQTQSSLFSGCWHAQKTNFETILNDYACDELRSKVWLAAEHKLSVELLELIFDLALGTGTLFT